MPSKYTEDQLGALEDITEAGGVFTLTHTPEVPDPDAQNMPWRKLPGNPTVASVHGVLTEYKQTAESQGFTAGSEDAKAILPGDMLLLVAAIDPGLVTAAIKPMPRDTLLAPDGQEYTVMTRNEVAPDGIAILYKLRVRK